MRPIHYAAKHDHSIGVMGVFLERGSCVRSLLFPEEWENKVPMTPKEIAQQEGAMKMVAFLTEWESRPGIDRYPCSASPTCYKAFKTQEECMEHMMSTHECVGKCNLCYKAFTDLDEFYSHPSKGCPQGSS